MIEEMKQPNRVLQGLADGGSIEIPVADFWRYSTRYPNKVFVCVLVIREGAAMFIQSVENLLFPPGTQANDGLDFYAVTWDDLHYGILAVPLRKLEAVQDIATALRLRLVPGTPTLISAGDAKAILEPSPNVYTIEGGAPRGQGR